VHHDTVADAFELKREERAAFALPSGQIASRGLNVSGQNQIQLRRLTALRLHDEGEQLLELRHPHWTF
jgi:hypothetical protein